MAHVLGFANDHPEGDIDQSPCQGTAPGMLHLEAVNQLSLVWSSYSGLAQGPWMLGRISRWSSSGTGHCPRPDKAD